MHDKVIIEVEISPISIPEDLYWWLYLCTLVDPDIDSCEAIYTLSNHDELINIVKCMSYDLLMYKQDNPYNMNEIISARLGFVGGGVYRLPIKSWLKFCIPREKKDEPFIDHLDNNCLKGHLVY